MPLRIKRKANLLYPIEGEELRTGIIYEGTDRLLYVGTNGLGITHGEYDVMGVGIDHDAYVSDHPSGTPITFRAINATLEY